LIRMRSCFLVACKKMRILHWMYGQARRDEIRNCNIRER